MRLTNGWLVDVCVRPVSSVTHTPQDSRRTPPRKAETRLRTQHVFRVTIARALVKAIQDKALDEWVALYTAYFLKYLESFQRCCRAENRTNCWMTHPTGPCPRMPSRSAAGKYGSSSTYHLHPEQGTSRSCIMFAPLPTWTAQSPDLAVCLPSWPDLGSSTRRAP